MLLLNRTTTTVQLTSPPLRLQANIVSLSVQGKDFKHWRSLKVIDFGVNSEPTYDFQVSDLSTIWHHFLTEHSITERWQRDRWLTLWWQ